MTRARILYVLPPTGKFAGIERVVDEIANTIAVDYGSRFEIAVLHLSDYGDYAIGPRAYTYLKGSIRGRMHQMGVLRRMIGHGNYDLVVVPQIEPTAIVWVACLGLGPRLVLHLHGNPRHENTHPKANILFGIFRMLVLDRLAYVFGTSPKQLMAFGRDFPGAASHWTPNPVREFPAMEREARDDDDRVVFVNVGRFCFQKGQDLIIEAFADVVRLRPKARLVLVGYGEEKAGLLAQASTLGIADSVSFEHHPQDPVRPLAAADVYVSLSRWEGWSLAICEALRVGLPVVSSDCEFGPSDILTDERLGRLVRTDDKAGAVGAMLYYHDNIVAERAFAEFRSAYVARFDVAKVAAEHALALTKAAGRPVAGAPRREAGNPWDGRRSA